SNSEPPVKAEVPLDLEPSVKASANLESSARRPSPIRTKSPSRSEPEGQPVEPELIVRSGSVSALKEPSSGTVFDPVNGLAAVALVLSGRDSNLKMCFIERAEREGDPWSGHMAFPGGRASASDPTPQAVAERETEEEVGLRLNQESFLGELSYLPVTRRRVETGMMLYPFVYYIGEPSPEMTLSDEVANSFWIPMEHLWRRENLHRVEFKVNEQTLLYPAIRFHNYSIWGLTYRVLTQFSVVIGVPLPSK
ncbi:MAG TPA: CoA pyrophosphatase, partial [Blastocatellia bacterium]|nr:CoA pyrophosphatase [Blastocatellia bacterium]